MAKEKESPNFCGSCGQTYMVYRKEEDGRVIEFCPYCGETRILPKKEADSIVFNEITTERAFELLRSVVDYVAVAENTAGQVHVLKSMGFEEKDLLFFGYSHADIEEPDDSDILPLDSDKALLEKENSPKTNGCYDKDKDCESCMSQQICIDYAEMMYPEKEGKR